MSVLPDNCVETLADQVPGSSAGNEEPSGVSKVEAAAGRWVTSAVLDARCHASFGPPHDSKSGAARPASDKSGRDERDVRA